MHSTSRSSTQKISPKKIARNINKNPNNLKNIGSCIDLIHNPFVSIPFAQLPILFWLCTVSTPRAASLIEATIQTSCRFLPWTLLWVGFNWQRSTTRRTSKQITTTNFSEIYGKWILRILMGSMAKDDMVKMRKNAHTKNQEEDGKKGDKED